jgi:hypothetical protein
MVDPADISTKLSQKGGVCLPAVLPDLARRAESTKWPGAYLSLSTLVLPKENVCVALHDHGSQL